MHALKPETAGLSGLSRTAVEMTTLVLGGTATLPVARHILAAAATGSARAIVAVFSLMITLYLIARLAGVLADLVALRRRRAVALERAEDAAAAVNQLLARPH
jgi:hypothetical protein